MARRRAHRHGAQLWPRLRLGCCAQCRAQNSWPRSPRSPRHSHSLPRARQSDAPASGGRGRVICLPFSVVAFGSQQDLAAAFGNYTHGSQQPGCGQLHSQRGAQGQAYDIAAKCRRGLTQSEVYSTFEGLAAGRAQPFKLVWRRLRVNVLCARTECMWATLAAVWRA